MKFVIKLITNLVDCFSIKTVEQSEVDYWDPERVYNKGEAVCVQGCSIIVVSKQDNNRGHCITEIDYWVIDHNYTLRG